MVEIGTGSGYFLAEMARRHPEWNFLGVDLSTASVTRSYRRISEENPDNLRLFCGHGLFVLRDALASESVTEIYVNFPDPWPKPKHRNRRLLTADFFQAAARCLVDDGTIRLTTDSTAYVEFARSEARQTALYDIDSGEPPPNVLRSKYARRFQEQRPIEHLVFHPKNADITVTPHIQPKSMQHAKLEGSMPRLEQFEKLPSQFDGGTVIILSAYRGIERDEYIFPTRIEEGDLVQEILLKVVPQDDRLLVSVERFGTPLATRGAAEAVHLLTDWLKEHNCDVIDRSY